MENTTVQPEQTQDWYFTFGSAHIGEFDGALSNKYMMVPDSTFAAARELIFEYTYGHFCTQYTKSDFDKINAQFPMQYVKHQHVHC